MAFISSWSFPHGFLLKQISVLARKVPFKNECPCILSLMPWVEWKGEQSRAMLLSKVTVSCVALVEEGGSCQSGCWGDNGGSEWGWWNSFQTPLGWRFVTPGKCYHVTHHSSAATAFTPCHLYSTPAVPGEEPQASSVLKLSGKLLDGITFKWLAYLQFLRRLLQA